MNELETDVYKAIRANLPAATAQHLSTYLDECRANNERLKEMIAERDRLLVKNNELQAELSPMRKEVEKANAVLGRENEVAKRELKQSLLEQEVKELKERVELAKWFFEIPFKNRVVREKINGYDAIPPAPPGGYSGSGSVSREIEKKEE